jgi:PAS domain S-box-containing protein
VTTTRNIQTFAVLTVIAIVASAALGVWSTARVYSNDTRVSHSYEVKAALAEVVTALMDAETGQRGYLITGNDTYLEPYRRGTGAIDAVLAKLESLMRDSDGQQQRLMVLRAEVVQKLRELAQTVNTRRVDGFVAAQKIVDTNLGKLTMERIRAIVNDMNREEEARLETRRRESTSGVRLATLTEIATAIIGIILIASVTRASQRRLADAEERERLALRLADIVESTDDAVIGKDLDGTLTAWNAAAERLYGYTAAEAIGQSIRIIVPPDKFAEEDEVLTRIRRGEKTEHFDTIRRAKDGRLIEVSLTVSPIKTRSGEIIGASKIARDLTPLRAYASDLECKVKERTADLEAANARLEAFAFSVAHDLRAPLRGMHGLSLALLEDYGERLDLVGRDYAQRIVQEAVSLDTLIQDLLAYGRLSHVELATAPVPLNDVFDAAVRTVREDIAAKQAQVEIDSALPAVRGNRSVLIQVFANLLSNAVKFGGSEPRVHVWAETRDDGTVHIWVEDQGIGIAPQHYDRIFGVFERLHGVETYPGTGIGLAIVRKGIERLGGRVGVESEEGRGSRFWVELPSAEAA